MSVMYVVDGPVRGWCGHRHTSLAAAQRCQRDDATGCRSVGGYSDRLVYAEDESGERTLVGPARDYGVDRSVNVNMRVTPAERDAYDAAAEAAGVSRSEWLRALAAEALSAGEATDPSAPPTRT